MNASAWSSRPAPPSSRRRPRAAGAGTPLDLRHAALGLLSDAVGGASRTPARARARGRHLAASARRRAAPLDRVGKLVGRLPGMPRAMSRLRAWRNQRTGTARPLGRAGAARTGAQPRPGPRRAHRAAREHARARLREPGRQGRHPGAERGDRGDRPWASCASAPRAPTTWRNGPWAACSAVADEAMAMTAAVVTTDRRAGFVTRLAALVVDMIILSAALRRHRVVAAAGGARPSAASPRRSASGQLVIVCAPRDRLPLQHRLLVALGADAGKMVARPARRRARRRKSWHRSSGAPIRRLPALRAPFYLGFLWVLGPERRGFHDRLAGTEVVYTRRPRRKLPRPDDRPRVPRRYVTA